MTEEEENKGHMDTSPPAPQWPDVGEVGEVMCGFSCPGYGQEIETEEKQKQSSVKIVRRGVVQSWGPSMDQSMALQVDLTLDQQAPATTKAMSLFGKVPLDKLIFLLSVQLIHGIHSQVLNMNCQIAHTSKKMCLCKDKAEVSPPIIPICLSL